MIIQGDALTVLKAEADESIQCCVTSPPYWGLRDYGFPGQFGLEKTPEEYVSKMVEVFKEARRVLRGDGTLWLNLGDSYWGGGNYRGTNEATLTDKQRSNRGAHGLEAIGRIDIPPTCHKPLNGAKPKDLVGIPWMVAFALRADGWYLRSDIIWAKPNPMPESVTDRPTKSHEYLFLLSKSQRYYYDGDAVREPSTERPSGNKKRFIADGCERSRLNTHLGSSVPFEPKGNSRNIRSVWTIATQPFKGAHFATFPERLVEPCIKAGSKEGDTVLDPFCGAATVGLVCKKLYRNFIGIELNPEYCSMGEKRILSECGGLL